jgi:ribosomal-protein-alanine N-acetyltransferase
VTEGVELRTDRLLLRPYRLEDVDDVYAYAKDPGWDWFLVPGSPQPYTRRNAEESVARRLMAPWGTSPSFAMVLDSVVIGGISLSVDEFHENAQLSYSLARVHWGKGLTTEAATAIVDWGFGALGLMKVYGNSDLRHVASWRVMEKIGMTREGILRSHRRAREGRSDRIYYGILREDWEAASADDSGGQQ